MQNPRILTQSFKPEIMFNRASCGAKEWLLKWSLKVLYRFCVNHCQSIFACYYNHSCSSVPGDHKSYLHKGDLIMYSAAMLVVV